MELMEDGLGKRGSGTRVEKEREGRGHGVQKEGREKEERGIGGEERETWSISAGGRQRGY